MEIKPINTTSNNQQSYYTSANNSNSINKTDINTKTQNVEQQNSTKDSNNTTQNNKFNPLNRRESLPENERWKYDLVNLLLKRAIYVPPKSFYSRFELFI